MGDERQPTAAERLPDALTGRLADIRAMLDREDPYEGDDDLPGLNEYGLGSTVRYSIKVELSTGGPADYVTADVEAGEVVTATYHFADWWDHAAERLTGPAFDTIAEWLGTLFDLDDLSMYVESRGR